MDVTLILPIAPQSKLAAAPTLRGRRAGTRKAEATRAYEETLRQAIVDRWPAGVAPHGPVAVDFLFVFARPRRLCVARCPDGVIVAPVKPDWDNLVKAAQDALVKSGAIGDDAAIVLGQAAKVYAERDREARVVLRVYDAPVGWPTWVGHLLQVDDLAGEEWTR